MMTPIFWTNFSTRAIPNPKLQTPAPCCHCHYVKIYFSWENALGLSSPRIIIMPHRGIAVLEGGYPCVITAQSEGGKTRKMPCPAKKNFFLALPSGAPTEQRFFVRKKSEIILFCRSRNYNFLLFPAKKRIDGKVSPF